MKYKFTKPFEFEYTSINNIGVRTTSNFKFDTGQVVELINGVVSSDPKKAIGGGQWITSYDYSNIYVPLSYLIPAADSDKVTMAKLVLDKQDVIIKEKLITPIKIVIIVAVLVIVFIIGRIVYKKFK